MRCLAFASILVLSLSATALAGFSIGPGDITTTNGDRAYDLFVVDLKGQSWIVPGTYTASGFNHQMSAFPGYASVGDITPVVLVKSGSDYVPVAIGDSVAYAGATGFISTPFGGSDTFALSSATTVYAGLYWHMTGNATDREERMPVGYANDGTSFVVYGDCSGAGAQPPQIGTAISGTGSGTFVREYDFSITLDAANPAPEPPTLIMALAGAIVLGVGASRTWRRGVIVD